MEKDILRKWTQEASQFVISDKIDFSAKIAGPKYTAYSSRKKIHHEDISKRRADHL